MMMTDLLGGRLRVALSCGAASCALLSLSVAQGQDTTVDGARTTPVVLSADGTVTVTADGTITLDGEDDATTAITVEGERTGDVSVAGSISIASAVETDTNENPASFPLGRFGLLVADDARLTGDVTFDEGASILVDTDGGAGIGVLGALDGDLSVAANVLVEGNNSAGLRIAGPVTGDVTIAAVERGNGITAAVIEGRGLETHAVDIAGDVDGQLTVGRTLRARVFTDGLTGDGLTSPDDADTPLTADQQAALVGGNALRVTGDIGGGIVLAAQTEATAGTDTVAAQPARTGSVLTSEGISAALYIGDGAVIGNGTDDPGTDVDESFGLFNGGIISGAGNVLGGSASAVFIEDASIAGGLLNAAGAQITAEAVGLNAAATGVIFDEDASLGAVVNEGSILVSLIGDTGDAIGVADRSGTVSRFVNNGLITVTVGDFNDLDANTDTDEEAPSGIAIAADLSANTSGVDFANGGVITGDVRLGSGDDVLSNTGALRGDISTGAGADTVLLDGTNGPPTAFFGFGIGNVDTGDGDDEIIVSGGAFLGQLVQNTFPFANAVDLGEGSDTLTVTGAQSRVISLLNFGGGGGGLNVLDGGAFEGTITGADDVDVVVGGNGSLLRLFDDTTNVQSLTTRAGATVTEDDGTTTTQDGAILAFQVDVVGQNVSALNVSGDAIIADDTLFRTEFQAAFIDDLSAPIITAGGDLDIDLTNATERLDLDGAVPFLFSQTLTLSDDGQSVLLELDRRSADEVGLDPVRAAAYEPFIAALVRANDATFDDAGDIVQAADVEIGRAIFNIGATPDGNNPQTGQQRFSEAFDQFLPGPLDAPLTYARAQTNSVTSLVTQRITQLRETPTRQRRFWLQESSYFVNQDPTESGPGFDGGGFVIAIGADAPLGPVDTVGVTASIATARYDEQTGEDFPFDRLTYNFGAYAAQKLGPLQLDGRVAYGVSNSESQRNVVLVARDDEGMATGDGDINRLANATWDGTQLNGYARALYAGELGAWDVQPFASLDYIKISEDPFQETGDDLRAVALRAARREAESLRGNVGVILGREFKTRPGRFETSIPATIAPRLTVAYSDELNNDLLTGTYRFEGGEDFTLTQEKPGGAAIVGADIAYENEYARLGLGASVTASEETQIYGLRIGVGLKW